jgi:hypothetical protein
MDKPTQTLLVVFIAIAAVSILAQACFTVGMFIAARKAQKKIMGLADDVRLHALPAIIASRRYSGPYTQAENHHRQSDRHQHYPARQD